MNFLWLIPTLPLVGAIANGLFGRRLSRQGSSWLAVVMVSAAFLLSLAATLSLVGMPPERRVIHDTVYNWIGVGSFQVNVGFWLDPLSAVMILVVSGVGALIHLYTVEYMKHDRDYVR